jgi:prevent-host-death family protein
LVLKNAQCFYAIKLIFFLTILAKLAKIVSMKTVSIHDAKTNLSKYIAAAKKGEKVYIGGFGKPEVLLVKISDQDNALLNKRVFAIGKGKITAKVDAFSDSTERDVTALMSGE